MTVECRHEMISWSRSPVPHMSLLSLSF